MPAGRPSSYTPEIAARICALLEEGESLRKLCKADDMPGFTTVKTWLKARPEFQAQYARAREEQAHALADEVLDIARECGPEDAASARVAVDALKWRAGKLLPKVYGDRTVLAGDPEAPLIPPETRREPAEFLAAWRKSQEAKKDE